VDTLSGIDAIEFADGVVVLVSLDFERPTVAITADHIVLGAGATATITFTLSEPSVDFDVTDVFVEGGAISDFTGSDTRFTATFTPYPDSNVAGRINVESNKFSDVSGNYNVDGADSDNQILIAIDTASPTIALSISKNSLRTDETATVIFTLSEASTNFTESDVRVTGGVLSNFSGSGVSYSAQLSLIVSNMVAGILTVPSGVFTDITGNANGDGGDSDNSLSITPINSPPFGELLISGRPIQGEILTVSHSLVDVDGLGTLSYQWLAAGIPIVAATGPIFTATQAEVGKSISVRSSYVDHRGRTEEVLSAATVLVVNVNDAPVADTASITTGEDTPQSGVLSATDIDSDRLTFSKVTDPAHGSVVVNVDGSFTYTPAQNFNGADSFSFTVNDASVDSAAATVSITVNAVNDAPIASAMSVTTGEDAAKGGTLVATDIDSPTLTYSVAANPSNGSVTVNPNGTFTYTPKPNFHGTDTFTFRASDGELDSSAAAVSIMVAAVNDPPSGAAAVIQTPEDTPRTFSASDFGFTDIDPGDGLTAVRIDSVPSVTAGTLSLSGNPVAAGQVIPAASLTQLQFVPASDVSGSIRAPSAFDITFARKSATTGTLQFALAQGQSVDISLQAYVKLIGATPVGNGRDAANGDGWMVDFKPTNEVAGAYRLAALTFDITPQPLTAIASLDVTFPEGTQAIGVSAFEIYAPLPLDDNHMLPSSDESVNLDGTPATTHTASFEFSVRDASLFASVPSTMGASDFLCVRR
jgi:VCBS repeat-containing protein